MSQTIYAATREVFRGDSYRKAYQNKHYGGHFHEEPKRSIADTQRIEAAARDIRKNVLFDDQWHPRKEVRLVAEKHGVKVTTVIDYLYAAVDGNYVAIPGDNTPLSVDGESDVTLGDIEYEH